MWKWGLLGCVFGLWAWNSSLLVAGIDRHQTRLIAHRGVHQVYVGTDRSGDACHAAPVAPLSHRFIENTLPSMREAFRQGPDVVELDVHLTADRRLAVFHDWRLECRTDGVGVTREKTMAALKRLDLGYRIDDGSGAFALRGTGVGMMPTLAEVLDADLAGKILVNFKSRDAEDGKVFAALIAERGDAAALFGVYGGAPPVASARAAVPDLRGFDRAQLLDCLARYAVLGWSGYVPMSCHESFVMVPQNYAPFLWGWPHRFTRRMQRVGTDVILVGDYDGSGFSSGIDDPDAAARIPAQFHGLIWTNRIEVVAHILKPQSDPM